MKKACVIGWPVAHSRSPLIHRYWLERYGIEGSYTREAVEPQNLAGFIAALEARGYAGCNVTIPHKEAVFGLVTPADAATERLGAVNTIFRRDGRILGTNTDGEGFINSIRQSLPDLRLDDRRAVVLGAGGAAAAVVNALLDAGVAEVGLANRTREKAELLRSRFGPRVAPFSWQDVSGRISECGLLVNTTSLGMSGQPPLDIDLSLLSPDAVVTDIVYTPLRTPLLDAAARRGNRVVEGLGMLLHQAVPAFERWFGVRPKVTSRLRDLVVADLEKA